MYKENEGFRIFKIIYKQKKSSNTNIPDFKTYYIATLIKTICYWQEEQIDRIELESRNSPVQVWPSFFKRCQSNSAEKLKSFQKNV